MPPSAFRAGQTDGVKRTTAAAGATAAAVPAARSGCQHSPVCPSADRADREAAHTLASHPEQGWSLLCNGIVLFDDTGELLPDGRVIAPHRPTDVRPEVFGIFAVA